MNKRHQTMICFSLQDVLSEQIHLQISVGFADPAEFQRESTAAEKAAFNQVTGRVTRHRAAKEDINVPTHQRCAQAGQSSKQK